MPMDINRLTQSIIIMITILIDKSDRKCWVWWYMPVIPAIQEAEVEGS
jgi:hypothetical protein